MDRTESRRTRRALPARALSGPIGTPDETLNKTFVEKGATMVDAVCLLGPTASGKTDLALALAEELPVEIISVDSAQVYRGLDVGSAKPDRATLRRVPHHLIDIRDPAEPYSAAEFREDALELIGQIRARRRIPLLVGGTMLYFRVLRDGIADMPDRDPVVRARIETMAAREGWPAVHARLKEVDPETAARLHPNDPQRVQRALEVFELTGRPMSEVHRGAGSAPCPWKLLELGIDTPDRAVLHARIERRFKAMLAVGFVDEVKQLRARGDLNAALPAIRAVGYRQIWEHLDGDYDAAEMVRRGCAATRQLAKRQLTWMRSWKGLRRVGADPAECLKILRSHRILR